MIEAETEGFLIAEEDGRVVGTVGAQVTVVVRSGSGLRRSGSGGGESLLVELEELWVAAKGRVPEPL